STCRARLPELAAHAVGAVAAARARIAADAAAAASEAQRAAVAAVDNTAVVATAVVAAAAVAAQAAIDYMRLSVAPFASQAERVVADTSAQTEAVALRLARSLCCVSLRSEWI